MMSILGQGTEALGPTLGPWANLTAVAALIGLLVWMVTKFMPNLMAEQKKEREQIAVIERTERTEQRNDFLSALAERDTKIEKLVQSQTVIITKTELALSESTRMMATTAEYIGKLKRTEAVIPVQIQSPQKVEVHSESGIISTGRDKGSA